MVKPISRTRQEYEAVYSDIRRYGGMPYEQMPFDQQDEIADCALLSFDYHDSEFPGWINRQRMSQFHNRMHLIMFTGSIPF